MENDGMLEVQTWVGYYRTPPLKGNRGLELMPCVGECDTKPFISGGGAGGGYLHLECGDMEPSTALMDFTRDFWCNSNIDSSKMLHLLQGNHQHHSHSYGTLLSEPSLAGTGAHSFQMLLQLEVPGEEKVLPIDKATLSPPQPDANSLKKRSKRRRRPSKTSKEKEPMDKSINPSGRGRTVMKSMNMVINGIDLDILGMPAPVCTCTGQPQQCYRWGAGGWQSACCTTCISLYPLPMSIKRRGARIAGRKMSHGAFKKVLEKLAGDGQDFSSPIDLKLLWAKHGTNKFVTIR